MPRRIADEEADETPRRRRKPKAVVVEAEPEPDSERGLVLRILLHSPKDTVAATLALAAIGAILTNALFLQTGPHPSPMFGSVVTLPAPWAPQTSPLPHSRPADTKADAGPAVETKPADGKAAEPKAADSKAPDSKSSDARTTDPLASLVKSTSGAPVATSSIPRPPVSVPINSHDDALSPGGTRRVAAVQRALTEYGYGQLRTTGIVDAGTQAAIIKFEHARKIPATGQMTERMVRELGTMIGHPID